MKIVDFIVFCRLQENHNQKFTDKVVRWSKSVDFSVDLKLISALYPTLLDF